MRVFVALEIPDAGVLDALVSFQRELLATGADLKPVERQNIHFTLKFLGEVSQAMAEEAGRRLAGLQLKSEVVSIRGVGSFPSASRPNVVWVGVAPEHTIKVSGIANAVVGSLTDIGERNDRPFQAHATLARVRSGRNREGLSSLLKANSAKDFGTIKLTTIRLKSSQLTPGGPIYSDLGVYTLS